MSSTSLCAIEECRRNHEAARRFGFQPEVNNLTTANEVAIFQHGRTVWASIVKANEALYRTGKLDARGCVVFSFDLHFDEYADDLTTISMAVSALHGKPSTDSALQAFATVVSDDYSITPRIDVPKILTKGRQIQYQELYFFRKRLPTGYLIAANQIPVIADHSQSNAIMLLPLKYWSENLISYWKNLAAMQPSVPSVNVTVISFDEFAKKPLILTSSAAGELRRIMAKQGFTKPILRVGEEQGQFSMDLIKAPTNNDFSYMSQEIQLVISPQCAKNLMGLEIDFVESSQKRGFKFNRR